MIGATLIHSLIYISTLKQSRNISRQRKKFHLEYENIRNSYRVQNNIKYVDFSVPFYATYLPVIYYIGYWLLWQKKENKYQMVTRSWIYSFSSLNSCINPFIYALRTKRFKKASYRFWCNITYYYK